MDTIIVPLVQMKKLEHEKIEHLAQEQAATQCWSWDSGPGRLLHDLLLPMFYCGMSTHQRRFQRWEVMVALRASLGLLS